jgi:hypothetical protein
MCSERMAKRRRYPACTRVDRIQDSRTCEGASYVVKNDRKSMRGGDGVQQCGYAIALTAGINRTCSQITPARKTRRLSAGAGSHLVLDETDDCGQDRSSDTAACNLTDQDAKVQAASCYSSQRWDEGLEKVVRQRRRRPRRRGCCRGFRDSHLSDRHPRHFRPWRRQRPG